MPSIVIGLVGTKWGEQAFSYLCYFIPVLYAGYRIWEVDSKIKSVMTKKVEEKVEK